MAVLSAVRARVWLLRLKCYEGVRGSLSRNTAREICAYFEDLLVYQVTSRFLCSFNCQTLTWGPKVPLRTQIQVDQHSIWVVLKDGRSLLCSGGGYSTASTGYSATWSTAFLISREEEVNSLPNMLTGRSCHGVIQLLHLYVFGGHKH